MTKVLGKNFFAAMPARMMSDERLAALHFRVLAVIAVHDRMGRNGQHCWAGNGHAGRQFLDRVRSTMHNLPKNHRY